MGVNLNFRSEKPELWTVYLSLYKSSDCPPLPPTKGGKKSHENVARWREHTNKVKGIGSKDLCAVT
jgi:hypothetical protein